MYKSSADRLKKWKIHLFQGELNMLHVTELLTCICRTYFKKLKIRCPVLSDEISTHAYLVFIPILPPLISIIRLYNRFHETRFQKKL